MNQSQEVSFYDVISVTIIGASHSLVKSYIIDRIFLSIVVRTNTSTVNNIHDYTIMLINVVKNLMRKRLCH